MQHNFSKHFTLVFLTVAFAANVQAQADFNFEFFPAPKYMRIDSRLYLDTVANEHTGRIIDPDVPGRTLNCSQYLQESKALSPNAEMFPFGVAVGIVELVDCRPMTPADARIACVEYRPGLFAWEFENPLLIEPFPVKGNIGFFKVDQSLIAFK